MSRFGELTERELDIAEYVAKESIRATAQAMAELMKTDLATMWVNGLKGFDRERLRRKIEAAS